MAALWPAAVPMRDLVAGYSERRESNLAEFAPEVGPPKRRRRSSVATELVSFEQLLSEAEADALLAFWRDTLGDGALTFEREHPRTRVLAEFQFVAPPDVRALGGGVYRVGLQLRKMP